MLRTQHTHVVFIDGNFTANVDFGQTARLRGLHLLDALDHLHISGALWMVHLVTLDKVAGHKIADATFAVVTGSELLRVDRAGHHKCLLGLEVLEFKIGRPEDAEGVHPVHAFLDTDRRRHSCEHSLIFLTDSTLGAVQIHLWVFLCDLTPLAKPFTLR